MPPPDPAQATGLADAAAAFEGLLTSAEPAPRSRPARTNAATTSDTPEASDAADDGQAKGDEGTDNDQTEADRDTGETGDTGEAEGDTQDAADEGEGAADADEEAQEAASTRPPATVTVKVNGKEERVSLDEVVAGYQRHADYSQKTQAVAEERKILQAEAEELIQERQQYATLLPALRKQLEALQEREPDWNELYARDPLEYVRQRDLFRDRQERIAAANTEEARLENLKARERQQGLGRTLQEGRKKLVELVPEWKDPKRWESDRVRLVKFGQSIGFTEQELEQTYDPRAVFALHKAMKYDALMANKPRPVVRPNAPRVAPAGSAESVPRPQDRTNRASERLSKSGSLKDAAAVFEGIL